MNGYGYSWLRSDGQGFWARSRLPLAAPDFHPATDSSVVRLITGIYHLDSRWARKRLRNRIFSSEPIGESAWGTVKVAARRAIFSVPLAEDQLFSDATEVFREFSSASSSAFTTADSPLESWVLDRKARSPFLQSDEIWPFLDQLITEGRQKLGQVMSLPVSAVLLDSERRILSWGVNSAWDFRTEHAETNLIRRWRNAGSPGTPESFWVTRKCCKMCAGWIWDSWFAGRASRPVSIHFREPDNGPLARLTVLDPGSFENVRALSERGKP